MNQTFQENCPLDSSPEKFGDESKVPSSCSGAEDDTMTVTIVISSEDEAATTPSRALDKRPGSRGSPTRESPHKRHNVFRKKE